MANCPTNKFRDTFFAQLTITTCIDLAVCIYKEKGKKKKASFLLDEEAEEPAG